jgi:hypothetical protein
MLAFKTWVLVFVITIMALLMMLAAAVFMFR